MNYAILGTGNVGAALAAHFARNDIEVVLANTRGPASIATLTEALGPTVHAASIDDALASDVLILAVPFRAHAEIGARRKDWSGQVVVDAMNTYGIDPAQLGGLPSSVVVAKAFPGATLVKAFNQLPAKVLARDPREAGGRRVVFVCGDDAAANTQVSTLADALGFAPLVLGDLTSASPLIGLGGPLILKNLLLSA